MNLALTGSLLATGLLGSAHCVAMCGGIAAATGGQGLVSLAWLHMGRLVGYAVLGGLAGASGEALIESMKLSQMARPLWYAANAAAIITGASLLLFARQPRWLDAMGDHWGRWLKVRRKSVHPIVFVPKVALQTAAPDQVGAPTGGAHTAARQTSAVKRFFLLGIAWSALPCGFLYSALILVGVSTDPVSGAAAMAVFALATAMPLLVLQWTRSKLWSSSLRGVAARWQAMGARLLGALIVIAGGYAVLSLFGGGDGRLFCG